MCKVHSFIYCALMFWSISLSADQITEINNQIQAEGTGSTYISGFTFHNREVEYEKKTGVAIFEGDIVLGNIEEVEAWREAHRNVPQSSEGSNSVIITGDRYRWINNVVPFQFDGSVSASTRSMVLNAIAHWEANTHIRFIERHNGNADHFPDFVNVISNDFACWSYVGRRGGLQNLNVVSACGFGGAVHELGHALGLWHEQSREDRDSYIRINWENIEPPFESNFKQHIHDGDDIGEYDYGSIMHYGAYAFSANGMPTITPLRPVSIGQRGGLSELDIASIIFNYPEQVPVARITRDHYSVFLGDSVFFDGRQSFDPNGDSLHYEWRFGDGIESHASTAQHIYLIRGEYNITLNVSDPNGNSDTDTATTLVYGAEVLVPILH